MIAAPSIVTRTASNRGGAILPAAAMPASATLRIDGKLYTFHRVREPVRVPAYSSDARFGA